MELHQPIPLAASSTMFRAVFFNNKGVRRMQRGCFDDAVILFTRGLETLNPIIPNVREQHRFLSSTMPSMLTVSPDAPLFRQQVQHGGGYYDQPIEENHSNHHTNGDSRRVPDGQSHNHDTNKSYRSTFQCPAPPATFQADLAEEEHGSGPFVFQDPIEIPFDVVPTMEEPSEKLINKFVVVIMYNLALSVHLSALQSHDFTCWTKARKLYELAFQMHLEESCDVTLLYSLALLNNLGLIYHAMGDDVRSNACFKNMLATMMYLLESDEAKSIKQWDGLLSNVLDRLFKERQVAAPAA